MTHLNQPPNQLEVINHQSDRNDAQDSPEFLDQARASGLLINKLASFNMFLYANDVFSIYKGTHSRKRKHYELYRSAPLRMGPDWWDRMVRDWRPRVNLFLGYCAVRFSTLISLQILTYTISHQTTGSNSIRLARIRTLRFAGKLLGNPLSELFGTSIFLYSFILVNLLYPIGFAAHNYSKEPLNIASRRILINPRQELKRIKFVISRRLDYIRAMINAQISAQGQIKITNLRCSRYVGNFLTPDSMIRKGNTDLISSRLNQSKLLAGIQLEAVESLQTETYTMLPAVYEQHHKMQYYQSHLTKLVFIASAPFYSYVCYLIFSKGLGGRCNSTYIHQDEGNECTFEELFSLADMFALLELSLGALLGGYVIVFLNMTTIHSSIAQIILVDGSRKELDNILKRLSQINSSKSSTFEQPANFELEKALLRAYVKVSVTQEEVKSNVYAVTRVMQDNMLTVGYTTLTAILLRKMDGLGADNTLNAFSFWLLMITNASLIFSAYIYAKTIKIERLAWSLLAQIQIREIKEGRYRVDDFVASRWRRLVLSKSFSDKQNCYSPFGVGLNYGRVLQLNFMVISLASLTRSI